MVQDRSECRGFVRGNAWGVLLLLFTEEYHATCGPCGTILPRIAGSSYRSHSREDRVRKANRASQLKDADSARTRETPGGVVR